MGFEFRLLDFRARDLSRCAACCWVRRDHADPFVAVNTMQAIWDTYFPLGLKETEPVYSQDLAVVYVFRPFLVYVQI